ncbi:MAG: UTP--glucose-1-phosphate uridylyltransferase [Spirochaetales bacterium]|nr:UTP--glucose-1-phosphate uridylyltransferase [Spirochaetales bacterium]
MTGTTIEQWTERGQGHLFEAWERRDEPRRRRLLEDLRDLEPSLVESLREKLGQAEAAPKNLEPHPFLPLSRWREDPQALAAGRELLAGGRAGFLTAAGGQGSRLGYDGPKGCFPISPLRKASLFQILAEKILAGRRRYGTPMPWYIMGNPYNLESIRGFFQEHGWFGLPEEELCFFAQGTFPSLTEEGKLLLAGDGSLFKNPNGHGGVLQALHTQGLLDDMARRGVEELFYTQVDNPLVRVPDPAFLGMHRLTGSEMSSKVIAKAYPGEKLGVIGFVDGRPGVIEYSDLDDERQHARDEHGTLRYSHGSIAIHLLNVGFLRRLGYRLPLHQARKRVGAWDPASGRVTERQAVKFERFIFDAIPHARNPLFVETERHEEFAPLKNRTGVDSIETCRDGMVQQHARWLESAGVRLARRGGQLSVVVEISPLFAWDAESLKKRLGDSVNNIDEDTLLA